ncbi:MAG: DUF1801 domain-containing protein [Pseudomonadota bacterium]
MTPDVAAAFDAFPAELRPDFLALRRLILDIAAADPRIDITEALRWGQPAYLPGRTGTAVRLGPSKDGRAALLVHCGTTLIADHRMLFPDAMDYEGNRAAIPGDEAAARALIHAALTYRIGGRRGAAAGARPGGPQAARGQRPA